ncbi:MAG TPA: hypothetical protein VFY09_04870, partial [Flavobacteriaceae bacterium]|nr:hypothetical protein [Flavobacteriaceae bacterium]
MIPKVQTVLAHLVMNQINADYNTAIYIDKVDLSSLRVIKLKGVEIKDHHQDSMVYVKKLTINIEDYKRLLKENLDFKKVSFDELYLKIKIYKGETDDNFSHFLKLFDNPSDKKIKREFVLKASEIQLNGGEVYIIDDNNPRPLKAFFKKVEGTINNFKIQGPKVFAQIKQLALIDNNTIEIKDLTAQFSYSPEKIELLNAVLKTPTSNINAELIFTYKREDLSDFNNKVNINANIKEASISLIDVRKFYAEIGDNDQMQISTQMSGTLNNLLLNDFQLSSSSNAKVSGNFHLINSFEREKPFQLNANWNELETNYNHLTKLLPHILGKSLPKEFISLGQIKLHGSTTVTKKQLKGNVFLLTDLGEVFANGNLNNIDQLENVNYDGKVSVYDFNLGNYTNNSNVGLFSLDAKVKGTGFTLKKLNTNVEGEITKFQFKDYLYKNISVNGIYKNMQFNGLVAMTDENIKLQFDGLADLTGKIYTYKFNAKVDYAHINKLNLFTRDSLALLKGNLNFDVKGNSLNDLVGSINFKNASYQNEKDTYQFTDFTISSAFNEGIRHIDINSKDIIEGSLSGKFKFEEIIKIARNSLGSIYTHYKPFKVSKGQFVDFQFHIYNKLIEVFYPEIKLASNTFIKGSIDSDREQFKLNFKSPKLEAFKYTIKDIYLQIDNKNPLFNTQLSVEQLDIDQFSFRKVNMVNKTLNDTLFIKSSMEGGLEKNDTYQLSFFHTINKENKSIVGIEKSIVNIRDNEWIINPKNLERSQLIYDDVSKNIDINLINIESGNQKIDISGNLKGLEKKDILLQFENVELSKVIPPIKFIKMEGILNGLVNILEENKQITPISKVEISDLKINDLAYGNLKLDLLGTNSYKKYQVNLALKRKVWNSLIAEGYIDFNPKKPTLDLDINLENFEIDAFSVLGKGTITNIRGDLYGELKATGLLENPDINGFLYLDKAGM